MYNMVMRKYLILLSAIIPTTLGMGTHAICFKPFSQGIRAKQAEEKCLATAVYGEARGESLRGKIAVAYSALNRAVNRTICGVILAPKQYSIFNNNPTLRAAAMSPNIDPPKNNVIDERSWKESVMVAKIVISKSVSDPTHGATHYLADKVMKIKHYHYPKWSKEYKLITTIDNHKFYKKV